MNQPDRAQLTRDYGNLPMAFEPNVGQTEPQVRFLARTGGMTTYFTDTETVMVLSRSRQVLRPDDSGPEPSAGESEQAIVRMKLVGADEHLRSRGREKLAGVSNYFMGNDPAKWRVDVPHYARIEYEGVYPGIDLVWYGNQRRLEYDFVVAPGADPKAIQMSFEGVESLAVEAGGDLVLQTALGKIHQQRPLVYQEISGKRVEVKSRYAIMAGNRVSFEVARYDRKQELRIDPVVLAYSTYLGGNGVDWCNGIAVDAEGAAYVTGSTQSTNFPTWRAYQGTKLSGNNGFVTKLTPAGNDVVYSTYLGGGGTSSQAIAVDRVGSAYVTGFTGSTFPTTVSAYQENFKSGLNAFVTKLTPTGNAMVYSTYLGGEDNGSTGSGIAVDGAGSAYVFGATNQSTFPTQSAYQRTLGGGSDAFVAKLTPTGNALVYSTYLGGSGDEHAQGIAVDAAGSAFVCGSTSSSNFPTQSAYQKTFGGGSYDGFVTKLTPTGNALAYSTYLGGNGTDWCYGIAVDGSGSAYLSGSTSSKNFPIQSAYQTTFGGAFDGFVAKLTPSGNGLAFSTYMGRGVEGRAIAVDGDGSAYVVGAAILMKLEPAGNALAYAYEVGGRAYGIAVDGAGSAYVTGVTYSSLFTAQSAYQKTFQGGDSDAIVAKIRLDVSPQIANGGVANAASYVAGKVSPGEIIVIFGKDFGPTALAGLQLTNGKVSTELGETRVLFDGLAAPILYVVKGQISCIVPYEVAGKNTTQVVVEYKKLKGVTLAVPVVEAVPGLFSINSRGTGPGAFLNEDNSINTLANPLERGKIAVLYGTGEGQSTPGGVSGLPATTTFPKPMLPVTVTIGGKNAEVLYSGAAPYLVAGVIQINVRVPTEIATGNAEVIIKVGDNSSQAGVTLAVK